MPDAAWAVSVHPPSLSRKMGQPPVLTSSDRFRHFIDGSLAFASPNHACRNLVSAFPQRSPPSLVWGFVRQELKHDTNPFFLPRARVVVGKPSGDADRPRESGGGRRWFASSTSFDTRRSPLPLAVIFGSSRHILVFGGSKRSKP